MIALTSPITIEPAPVNGKPIKPIVLNDIDWSVSYDSNSATAFLRGANVPLRLWDGSTTPTYTAAGQFTDADVQNRVSQLLNVAGGNDAIKSAITALYPAPAAVVTPPVTVKSTPSKTKVSATIKPAVATVVGTTIPATAK